jgi:hypothetical protein
MSPAATEVPVHVLDDLRLGGVRVFLQRTVGIKDHPRSAKTALEGVMLKKRFLQGMEGFPFRQTFDRDHFFSPYVPYGNLAGAVGLFID